MQWLRKFRGWLSHTSGAWAIASDVDQATAVAQHYGIATDFIDFTSDPSVAAFFATHGADESAQTCCILCLNVEDLQRSWTDHRRGFRLPELIEISVPNLWRLEAQRGAFLFCPYADFERLYPLDRILFQRSTSTRLATEDRIYPTNKSQLEILLDQFFMKKAVVEATEMMAPVASTFHFDSPAEGYDLESFTAGRLPPLPSWDEEHVRPWRLLAPEVYHETVGDLEVHIDVPWRLDPGYLASDIARFVIGTLKGSRLRKHSLRFVLTAPHHRAPKAVQDVEQLLPRLWDGLRVLPYTDEELAQACGNLVAIRLGTPDHGVSETDEPEYWDPQPAIQRVLGATFKVEFAQSDGSYSRAFVREATLREIMRPDLYDLLKPEVRQVYRDSLDNLLFWVHAPERLFDFRRLAHLFAVELVPIQLLTRRLSSHVIVFSPARLARFGRP